MTESSVRPRQQPKEESDEGNDNDKKKNGAPSTPEQLVTTGQPILFCSEQLKRCDTTDTDQESCAYSTRAVLHFNTNNTQPPPSKHCRFLVFQTRNRRYHPRLAILGVTVTILCAVITGVALVILIPRRSRHYAGTNSSTNVVVGGGGGNNNHNNHNSNNNNNNNNNGTTNSNETNTTTNHDESNTTRPPNNTATNDTDNDITDCASLETADAAWNAIAHYNDDTINKNNNNTQDNNSTVLLLGPMVGHVTSTTAKIWAFLNHDSHAPLSILYQRLGSGVGVGKDCPSPKVEMLAKNIPLNQTTMELTNLEPDTRYRFHVLLNDTKIGKMGTFTTVPTDITKFRYMFGSCISFKRDANQTIWNHVLQQEPAFLVLNGDTVYSDTMNYSTHWEYHSKQRQIPTFANIIRQVPVYASWDDHDYGPNDSDGLGSGKEQSLQAFTDLFPNPSFGTPTHPGIYSTFSYGNHVRKRTFLLCLS
jgi:hypothetical protein